MNSNIFRAYDIRGLYQNELSSETSRLIGKAFASFIMRKYGIEHPRIIVGKDNRPHGVELQLAFIEGLLEHGVQVARVEDCPSPMLYHAVCEAGFDAGVNITASHNPADYNGFKLVGQEAHSICGEEIQIIKQMILDEDFEPTSEGEVQDIDIAEHYFESLAQLVSLSSPLKIVIDAGNGIAGKYYPELFRRLGCEVIELYCEQDGSFPNHEPDPVVEENTADLKQAVLDAKADLGLSFDGDGDRFAVIDEQGQYHDANQTLVLLAKDVLSRHPNSPVIYTVSCSGIVPAEVKALGGEPRMVPVGHSFVEQAMSEAGALIGGEQSGHFFVAENYYSYDDAAYAASTLLRIFTGSKTPVSEIYQALPAVYDRPEKRPHCPDDRKFELIKTIAEQLSEDYECNDMDGVRVEFGKGGWLGIRASNTSPCLSICMEAQSPEHLEEIESLANQILQDHGVEL